MKNLDEGASNRAEPCASSRDLFERDAIPLSDRLLRRALWMTRDHETQKTSCRRR